MILFKILFSVLVGCFILITYSDIRKGLSLIAYDLIKIIILPFAGVYKLFHICRKTKHIL